jgi:hypothetical protein
MLHKESVDNTTLELIKTLQSDLVFNEFILAGGTGLALQIGHRISVDIDFFTINEFDNQELLDHLTFHYGFSEQYRHRNTLKGTISGVFVDFIRHNYVYVEDPVVIEGIRMASKPDIAAMKVNAISGNGTRVKDFIDIYFLLKEMDFSEMIQHYKNKYQTNNDFHAIKSIAYFDDVILTEWPKMILEKDLDIRKLKKSIIEKRQTFLYKKTKS